MDNVLLESSYIPLVLQQGFLQSQFSLLVQPMKVVQFRDCVQASQIYYQCQLSILGNRLPVLFVECH